MRLLIALVLLLPFNLYAYDERIIGSWENITESIVWTFDLDREEPLDVWWKVKEGILYLSFRRGGTGVIEWSVHNRQLFVRPDSTYKWVPWAQYKIYEDTLHLDFGIDSIELTKL